MLLVDVFPFTASGDACISGGGYEERKKLRKQKTFKTEREDGADGDETGNSSFLPYGKLPRILCGVSGYI